MKDVAGSISETRQLWSRGPSMHKQPNDLIRYEKVLSQVKPKVLVETGLYYGGSQIWFAERVPHVINVELSDSTRDPDNQTTRDYYNNRHGLGVPPSNGLVVEGNSLEVFERVRHLVKGLASGEPVMVVLDSNHDTDTVYGEMLLYGQLVTKGSYMVVEDGILHHMEKGPFREGNWFDGDPQIAIEKYLQGHDDFEVDSEIEDMLPTTQHPMGWLRKR